MKSTVNIFHKVKFSEITEIYVSAKRWFQSSYGNTYHSVVLSAVVDGKWMDLAENTFEYGYGDHFVTTAAHLLKECLTDKEIKVTGDKDGFYTITRLCNHFNITLYSKVVDVKRKKDL